MRGRARRLLCTALCASRVQPSEAVACPRTISLEGNIGVGKSTLLEALRGRCFQTVDEPLEKWRGETGSGEAQTNLLELFYRDPQRWAFTFQSAAFLSRAQMAADALQRADPQSTFILERSIQSDKYCFAMNCLKTKLFTEAEWNVYNDFHTWCAQRSLSLATPAFYLTR